MTRRHLSTALATALALLPPPVHAQECFPFGPGERLAYSVRAAMLGAKGQATMTVTGPELVRGRVTIVLRSQTSAGVGFLRGTERTASWIDPARFASLRFVQQERHVIVTGSDSVEIMPEERRWSRGAGIAGETISDAPLDVLSFVYYLRTLRYDRDTAWTFNRHFDAARNPTVVRLVGRDTFTTPAGRFPVLSIEMQVRDKAHYGGDGIIRILLSDDARRTPVRIQSVMPVVGTTVLTLASQTTTDGGPCPVAGDRLVAGRQGFP